MKGGFKIACRLERREHHARVLLGPSDDDDRVPAKPTNRKALTVQPEIDEGIAQDRRERMNRGVHIGPFVSAGLGSIAKG